jgi:two-component system OmpR family sensor kinase
VPRSLYAKLAVILTALFGVVGLLFAFLLSRATEHYQQEVTQKLNTGLAEHIVAQRLLFRDGKIDREALEHIIQMLMAINPRIEVYLLDRTGKILAYSAPAGTVKRQSVDMAPIRRFIAHDFTPPLLGEDPRDLDRYKVFSAAPVDIDGDRTGYFYVILAGEQYDSVAQRLSSSYVIKMNTTLAVAVVAFALLAGLLLFALLTRRLHKLTVSVEGFQRTGFTGPLAQVGHGGDEIDRLALSFRAMADRIDAQVQQLRRTDSLRRELVANVSHDLRTPLASLQGYLETMRLKAGALSDTERRRYVDIALKHCHHLNQLVRELFDLAKLDANEVRPVLEPFALQELVQDVVQKFELPARQRKIELQVRYQETLPFVVGDIALIERVLDNLLENALRHTPAGGWVTLTLQPVGQAVAVRISDTGQGIAEQDLPHIFDRFYRPAKSRTQGAGLGLAIAKRILELHGSVIRADSAPGSGTAFAFDLPARSAEH